MIIAFFMYNDEMKNFDIKIAHQNLEREKTKQIKLIKSHIF